jgi:lipocalin-like protein
VKRSVLLMIVLASFGLTGRASAQARQVSADQQQLVGTWKLLSYVGEEVPSGVRSDVMGPHPSGYLNYGRDGRMMLIIVGSDRKKPAGTVATPEEAEALIRSMLAYAGKYTVDSEARTVTHHIDVSWDQSRTVNPTSAPSSWMPATLPLLPNLQGTRPPASRRCAR